MKFVIDVPDHYLKFREDRPGFLIVDAAIPHRPFEGCTIVAYEPGFIESLSEIEPDWEVVRMIAGQEAADEERARWHAGRAGQ